MRTFWCLIFLLFAATANAQTTLKIQWDQNLATEGVTSYNLYIDALPAVSVPNTLNAACSCIQQTAVFAHGPHTVKITAVAPDITCAGCGTGQPAPVLVESPPLTATFTINAGSQVKNVKVAKREPAIGSIDCVASGACRRAGGRCIHT